MSTPAPTADAAIAFTPADDAARLAGALALPVGRVLACVGLLDAGNTVPFISRYRKEATGGLDEVQLRAAEVLERLDAGTL